MNSVRDAYKQDPMTDMCDSVFTQFIPTLKILGSLFEKLHVKFIYFSGCMPKKKQEEAMGAFQNDPTIMVMVRLYKKKGLVISDVYEMLGFHLESRWSCTQPHCCESSHHRRPLVESGIGTASDKPRGSNRPNEEDVRRTHQDEARYGRAHCESADQKDGDGGANAAG